MINMSISWITINSKLQLGGALINSLTRTKFNLLLKHIVHANSDEIFTHDELTKLSESLKLDENNLQLLIQSIAHIFKQSSKVILKPTILQEQLIEYFGLDQEKAEDFVKVWTEETNNNFDLHDAKKVENISWESNVQSASSASPKEAIPNARIQLGVTDSKGTPENIPLVLELDQEQLLNFYNILEKIQVKLDNITIE